MRQAHQIKSCCYIISIDVFDIPNRDVGGEWAQSEHELYGGAPGCAQQEDGECGAEPPNRVEVRSDHD